MFSSASTHLSAICNFFLLIFSVQSDLLTPAISLPFCLLLNASFPYSQSQFYSSFSFEVAWPEPHPWPSAPVQAPSFTLSTEDFLVIASLPANSLLHANIDSVPISQFHPSILLSLDQIRLSRLPLPTFPWILSHAPKFSTLFTLHINIFPSIVLIA